MRYGFTTGSCAAAAAKAAAYMLLTGHKKTEISIITPKGPEFQAKLVDLKIDETEASCAVEKDGGDDPDITTGTLIYARVALDGHETGQAPVIRIDGGQGVGRVTRPGLDQPVGAAAINHVPRQMIEKEVLEICRLTDYKGGLSVVISVPDGVKLAEKTFNPRLGIQGGISILGTSGIVEPMSSQALIDTIEVELRQRSLNGTDIVAVAPGNYGIDFMKKQFDYALDQSVKCSNFVGETIDLAVRYGFKRMLFTGHIGKLVKLSGGIMNTHSKEADCRMELLAVAALRCHADTEIVLKVLECVTTEEALEYLKKSGQFKEIMQYIVDRSCYYMNKRTKGAMHIECIMYGGADGVLAVSAGAGQCLAQLKGRIE